MAFVLLFWGLLLSSATAAAPSLEQLADVGGHRLYIHCLGQGRPAVVMDAGLGGSSRDWRKVQAGLAPITQTCIYDRAGYGRSDPGPPPRTSDRIAAELRTLLARVGIPAPYILAGHSFGGFNMRRFASFYPEVTSGLVLVDAPHEGQVDDFFQNQIIRQLDPNGLLNDVWRSDLLSPLAANLEPFAAMLGLDVKTFRAIAGEAGAFKESASELENTVLRPDLPLAVIMHGRRVLPQGPVGDDMENSWMELQRDFVSRYKNGKLTLAKESSHNIPLDEPEIVVEAIREMMKGLRLQ
jgi:pimeloyl-ACP methyl ester carboxylesterase